MLNAVAITDFLLSLELLAFVIVLFWRKKSPFRNLEILFFLSLFFTTFFGGVHHSYIDYLSVYAILSWKMTLFFLGLVAMFLWFIGAYIVLDRRRNIVYAMVTLNFFVYAFYVLFVDSDFKVGVYNYVPAILFLGLIFLVLYFKKNSVLMLYGFLGVLLTFFASFIQQMQVGLSSVLDHNVIYHLIEAVAFYLIFKSFDYWSE